MVPAELVVGVAAAGARLALEHSTGLDAAPVHCVGVVIPGVSRVLQRSGASADAGPGRWLRVEVDVRGGISVYDDIDGGKSASADSVHVLLMCKAASARLGGGGTSTPASGAFDGDTLASPTTASCGSICSYAMSRRGTLDAGGPLSSGATDINSMMLINGSIGRGKGNENVTPVATMLISLDAVWFSDLGDDHSGHGDDKYDKIGVRRLLGGGAVRGVDPLSASSQVTSASCASWGLVGARTRVITQAAVDLEVSSSVLSASSSPLSVVPSPLEPRSHVVMTLLRWISSALFYAVSPVHGAANTSQPEREYDEEDASQRIQFKETAAAAILAEVLTVFNAFPRYDDADPIHSGTNLMDAGFDSLQVMELRRQLEGAGPLGCVLTAHAVMEHSTPAALTKHMMMWHKPSAGGDTARRRGGESAGQSEETGRRQQLSSSACRGDIGVGVGVGSGDQARMTLVLFGSCVVMLLLLMICFVLAVALYLARREVGVAQMAAVLEASRREGNDDGSTPTCVHD